MKAAFCLVWPGLYFPLALAEVAVVPEVVTDCINYSAVLKLAIAEFYDAGEGATHRFPTREEFGAFSVVREKGEVCRFVYHGEGAFEIDFDEASLGFESSIQPRITATPQAPYEETRAIDFRCSRGLTAEVDLDDLPETCRGRN